MHDSHKVQWERREEGERTCKCSRINKQKEVGFNQTFHLLTSVGVCVCRDIRGEEIKKSKKKVMRIKKQYVNVQKVAKVSKYKEKERKEISTK